MNKQILTKLVTSSVFSIVVTTALALFFWSATCFSLSDPVIIPTAYWDIKMLKMGEHLFLLLSFVLCLCNAFFLNGLVRRFEIIRMRTALPALFFVMLVGVDKMLITNISTLFGIFILIICLWQLFLMHENRGKVVNAFNIMLLLGTGSFVCFELLFFIPLFLMGFFMLKTANSRVLGAVFCGLFFSLSLLLSLFYLFDGWQIFLDYFNYNLSFRYNLIIDAANFLYYLLVLFLLVMAIVRMLNSFYREKNRVRLLMEYFFLCLFVLLVLSLFRGSLGSQILSLASVFAAVFLAHFFSLNSGKFAHILFWIYVISAFACFINQIIGELW